MLCEKCQERPATVRLRRTINNDTTEQHLCQQCAQESDELAMMAGSEFSLPAFFAGLLEAEKPGSSSTLPARVDVRCPECGLDYAEFRQGGRLGCGGCYRAFAQPLEPLLRRIHGHTEHGGKMPPGMGQRTRANRRLEELRAELRQRVQKEEFERAAELRDEIRALEAEIPGGEGA